MLIWFWILLILAPTLYMGLLISAGNQFIPLGQILFFLIPSLVFLKKFKKSLLVKRPSLPTFLKITGWVLILSLVMNALLVGIFKLYPPPASLIETYQKIFGPTTLENILMNVVMLAFVPAVCEELFFRGVILSGALELTDQNKAVFFTALFFSLYHMNPWLFPFLLVLGILFGNWMVKTESIYGAMVGHFVNNLLGIVLYHSFGMPS